MTLRRSLILSLAAFAAPLLGCADSSDPSETVPRQLYYLSYTPSGFVRLYGVALDGSSPISVVPDSTMTQLRVTQWLRPWISRDGRQIKVFGQSGDRKQTIVTVDPVGAVLSVIPYPDSVPGDRRPSLSPDGTRFAWYTTGFLNIATLDGVVEKINFDSLGYGSGEVAWSPDGGSVAFVTWHATQVKPDTPIDVRLWIRRLSDGFTLPLSLHGAAGAPAWSQDGKWVTVTANGSIHRLRSDGSGSEQVLYDGGLATASNSAWGPKDSVLAVVTGNGLLLIRPDGGGAQSQPQLGTMEYVAWRN